MAEQKLWLGSRGPFLFDDAEDVAIATTGNLTGSGSDELNMADEVAGQKGITIVDDGDGTITVEGNFDASTINTNANDELRVKPDGIGRNELAQNAVGPTELDEGEVYVWTAIHEHRTHVELRPSDVTQDGGFKDAPLLKLIGQYDSDTTTSVTSTDAVLTLQHDVYNDDPLESQLKVLFDGGGRLRLDRDGTLRVWDSGAAAYGEVWHAGNDGAGSNLDADQLDAQEGSYYETYVNVLTDQDGGYGSASIWISGGPDQGPAYESSSAKRDEFTLAGGTGITTEVNSNGAIVVKDDGTVSNHAFTDHTDASSITDGGTLSAGSILYSDGSGWTNNPDTLAPADNELLIWDNTNTRWSTALVNTAQIAANSIGTNELSFDTATQTELNNHAGNASAHHVKYILDIEDDSDNTTTVDDSSTLTFSGSTDIDVLVGAQSVTISYSGGAGNMDSWDIGDNSGSYDTISNQDTVDIVGGNGLNSSLSGLNPAHITLDIASNGVGSNEIAGGAVGSTQLASGAVQEGQMGSLGYVDFDNNEQGDWDVDGRLYWDLSAGLYIRSGNAGNTQTGGSLLWSHANFTAGDGINVNYGTEDEPTLSVASDVARTDVNETFNGYIRSSDQAEVALGDAPLLDVATNIQAFDGGASTYYIDTDHHTAFQIRRHSSGSGFTTDFWHDQNGNTGLGTTSPAYPLDVNGDIHSSNNVIWDSDRRIKDGYTPIDDPLGRIERITGYTGLKRGEPRAYHIAQEVHGVLPQAVDGTPGEEELLGLRSGGIDALQTEAIKELAEKYREERRKRQELQEEVTRLREVVDA